MLRMSIWRPGLPNFRWVLLPAYVMSVLSAHRFVLTSLACSLRIEWVLVRRGRRRQRMRAPQQKTRVTFDFRRAVELHNIIEPEQNPVEYYHTMGQSSAGPARSTRAKKHYHLLTLRCHNVATQSTSLIHLKPCAVRIRCTIVCCGWYIG